MPTDRVRGGRPSAAQTKPSKPAQSADRRADAGVLALQRQAGNAATATWMALQRQPKAPPDPIDQAGQLLRGLETWAEDEKKKQHRQESGDVVGLELNQAANVKAAAVKLAAAIPAMSKPGLSLDPVLADLKTARSWAEKARIAALSHDVADQTMVSHYLSECDAVMAKAKTDVAAVTGVKIATERKNVEVIAAAVKGSSPADLIKNLDTVSGQLGKVRDEVMARPDAARRVEILLRAFVAVNEPAFAKAPTKTELDGIKSLLAGGLGDDFVAVFGSAVDFQMLVDFANTLGQQIDARQEMSATTGKPAPRLPSQTEAKDYFAALSGKGNDKVFAAYQTFANGYFYHRGIASVGDLMLDVSDLFNAPMSITGRRGLVCTGFANIGALALQAAGGKVTGFTVGVHASDEMVRNNQLDEQGHAIARVTRNGAEVSVSNQSVVLNKNAMVGKDALKFGNQANPLFVGDGATTQEATQAMLKKIVTRKNKLK